MPLGQNASLANREIDRYSHSHRYSRSNWDHNAPQTSSIRPKKYGDKAQNSPQEKTLNNDRREVLFLSQVNRLAAEKSCNVVACPVDFGDCRSTN
jgi:hypothetical protein